MTRRNTLGIRLLFACVALGLAPRSVPVQAQDRKPDAEDAARIGIDAYVYGYSLVTMEMTRRV